MGLKLAATNLLKGLGVNELVYRVYYVCKTLDIKLFRPQTTLTVRQLTK
jgi:hypothetical protein